MKFLHHGTTSIEGHHTPVLSNGHGMVLSPVDPHVLFMACDDCHIHIYDAKEKTLIGAMSGHASWVLSIDVSPDGWPVATGSSDRTVRLWDISKRTSMQTMTSTYI
jgi:WD repeat-containing protein 61